MRISDWSSDVCSSDLLPLGSGPHKEIIPALRTPEVDVARVGIKLRMILLGGELILPPIGNRQYERAGGRPDIEQAPDNRFGIDHVLKHFHQEDRKSVV